MPGPRSGGCTGQRVGLCRSPLSACPPDASTHPPFGTLRAPPVLQDRRVRSPPTQACTTSIKTVAGQAPPAHEILKRISLGLCLFAFWWLSFEVTLGSRPPACLYNRKG